MAKKQLSFDLFYNDSAEYFGGHSIALEAFTERYRLSGGRALDIGAGEGRNAFYLASKGFTVTAVEPSVKGAQAILNRLKANEQDVKVVCADFLAAETEGNFDLIAAVTSLDHMDAEYLNNAVSRIKDLLSPGGYVFIIVFTEDDPGNKPDKRRASECAPFIRHYFGHGELKQIFSDFTVLEYIEYSSHDDSHGKPHDHYKAKLIAKKTGG